MMVFICTNRETDDEKSFSKAMDYARLVDSMGFVPCVTQALLRQWHSDEERVRGMCEEAVACCDEVWSFETPDAHTHALMHFARTLRMPVCNATRGGRRDYIFNKDMVR